MENYKITSLVVVDSSKNRILYPDELINLGLQKDEA
jgi:hypothetical protein